VRRILHHKALVFLALVIWLIASWSGAHGHLCFDGQEPPMTVHMDMLGDHPEHNIDEKHFDADLDVGQFVLAKLVKIDLPLLIATALLLVLLFKQPTIFVAFYSRLFISRIIGLRPPLRAPPAIPA
jgi:hypothetical protein